ALLVLFDDLFPLFLPLGLAVAQDDGTRLVLDGVEQDLHDVTGLRRDDLVQPVLLPLLEPDDALALVAHVHPHFVADDLEDPAVDDLVDLELLLLRRQPGVYGAAHVFLLKGGLEFLLKFGLGQIKLAEEVTVDHGNTIPRAPVSGTLAPTLGASV